MTDNYDLDASEHAEGHEHEHEMVGDHEPKAEAWQDDQPPVDDLLEDGAQVSEDSGATHEEVVETKNRKASMVFPIALGVVCIAVLGIVINWQLNRSSSSAPTSMQIAAKPMPKVALAAPDAGMPEVAPKTALTNTPSSVGMAMPMNNSNNDTANFVPSPTSQPTAAAGISSNAPASAASAPSAVVASVAPPPPMPEATTPTPAPMPVVESVPTTSTVSATTGNTQNIDARIASLSARVDELKKSLDQATQQLSQAQTGVSLSATSGTSNAQVEDRLTKVEQQLAQLEHAPATPPVLTLSSTTSEPEAATENNVFPSVKSNVLPSAKSTAHTSKHRAARTHRSTKKASAAKSVAHTSKSSAPASKWVLRAATPDEAWVAKDSTTSDLRHIMVGDELQGIGRIKAIHQVGDTWTVEGTKGNLH